MLRIQHAQLDRLKPAHRRRLREIASRARADIDARLRQARPESFTAQNLRVLRVQVAAVAAAFGDEMAEALRDFDRVAAEIARDGLTAVIGAWEPQFEGSVRNISRVPQGAALLEDVLLTRFEASRQFYGADAIRRMQGALAEAQLTGETVIQTTVRMARAMSMPAWRAERIVRTEHSWAYHRQQLADFREALGDESSEWRKTLIATFDGRTGDDSKRVHKQVRRLHEKFDDGVRKYMHPPSRPHDREVLVLVPAAAA